MSKTNIPSIKVGGMNVTTASRYELVRQMAADCYRARRGNLPRPRLIFDANGQSLSMRDTDPRYKRAVDQADVIHADGAFIVALSRFRKGPSISERSATTDMIHDAAAEAERLGLSFMLVGGAPGLAERTRARLNELYPRLRIVGCEHGYFPRHHETALIERINALQPDIVWVGLGKPREQEFCVRNRDRLKVGLMVTCGGCFHYITGDYRRAPLWMQRAGLEWLFRMATGPRNLTIRYITTNPRALYLALMK